MSSFTGIHILGIDYGKKVIGLATFCQGRDPFPFLHGRIIVENDIKSIEEIKTICDDESIEAIVLGLPFLTDGTESAMTKTVREFAKKLGKELSTIPVHLQDETLSTYEAHERMKNDPKFNFTVDLKQVDALSAAIIIESFINERKS